jgi:hypothetical protein
MQSKTLMLVMASILVLVLSPFTIQGGNPKSERLAKAEIKGFLEKFQQGYSNRDAAKVDPWVQELMTRDVYIIGTNAVYPNTGEWQVGHEKAKQLFANDWKRWGVLEADVENADIRIVKKNVALVAMTATVTKSIKNGYGRSKEENMKRCLKRLATLEKDDKKSTQLKLFTAIWDAGMVLKHAQLGETLIWPIRITMVLVKEKGKWKMAQTHYSYPMAGYPPVRLVDGQVVGY